MAILKNDILPAGVYNTLPHIDSVTDVPKEHADDIADLTALLTKYNLDDRVSVKLIHIHFQLKEGEVFAARNIFVPGFGDISIMQAVATRQYPTLYGHHYYVNDDGDLAAYEYMSLPGPDLTRYPSFVREFCELVQKRRLQSKLGLAVRHVEQVDAISELDYPAMRTCINVPAGVPLPYSAHSLDTTTEFVPFSAKGGKGGSCGRYCKYSKRQHQDMEDGWSDGNPTVENDSSDSQTASSSDDSDFGFDNKEFDVGFGGRDSFDPGLGLYVTKGPSRQINLAGRKLDKNTGLYKIVSFVSDNL